MWQIQSPRMQLILTLSGIHWQQGEDGNILHGVGHVHEFVKRRLDMD
jgi:hypothetical protein